MDVKNYGFIPPQPRKEDWVLGGKTKLKGTPILPSGNWEQWLPVKELQARGFDTNGCTQFATQTALETLHKFHFGEEKNFSERYLAVMSNNSREGNDPQKVIDTARKEGVIEEHLLPFSQDIDTWEKWKSPIPMTQDLINRGHEFLSKHGIYYEWVPADPHIMYETLKISPLCVSVRAWQQDESGIYDFDAFGHNHWVMIFKAEEGLCFYAFDSYDQVVKRIAWDAGFVHVMRYAIGEPQLKVIYRILLQIKAIYEALIVYLTTPKPLPPIIEFELPPPVKPIEPISKLFLIADAIKTYEGWMIGSRAYRNNNPGNLKYTEYTKKLGAVSYDPQNFCIFKDYDAGYGALCDFIMDAAMNRLTAYQDCDFFDFFSVYAPSSDGNKPVNYARWVATHVGVSPSAKLKDTI